MELIQPKLVATLGNFATKLSGKLAGITRVHGWEQEVSLGARTVLLYPIYHPAAALYTPSMLRCSRRTSRAFPRSSNARVEEPAAEVEPALAVLERDPSASARPLLVT